MPFILGDLWYLVGLCAGPLAEVALEGRVLSALTCSERGARGWNQGWMRARLMRNGLLVVTEQLE